jgi:hypothetical protein
MSPAECNYETHDQELLAVVCAFKQWRQYLEGAPQAVRVLVDHANLQGFMKVKQLNGRQARWATFLASFDFIIEHQAGKRNLADAPSRRSDYAEVQDHTSHLLPSLQKKLEAWHISDSGEGSGEPLVQRMRATIAALKVTIKSQDGRSPSSFLLPNLGTDTARDLNAEESDRIKNSGRDDEDDNTEVLWVGSACVPQERRGKRLYINNLQPVDSSSSSSAPGDRERTQGAG